MAEATFVQSGASIDYTPGSAVAVGQVIEQVNLIGVATKAIDANILGALMVEGVFDFAKETPLVIDAGDLVYWDDTANKATKTSSGNPYMGKCIKAAASADVLVRVKLDQ